MDRLYDYAFALMDTKIWDYFKNDRLFAYEGKPGEIYYICPSSNLNDYRSIDVFYGPDWIESFNLYNGYYNSPDDPDWFSDMVEARLFQIKYGSIDELHVFESEELEKYLKARASFHDEDFIPQFKKYLPFSPARMVLTENEEELFYQIIEKCLIINELIKIGDLDLSELKPISQAKTIPLIYVDNGNYIIDSLKVTYNKNRTYPVADNVDPEIFSKENLKDIDIDASLFVSRNQSTKSIEIDGTYMQMLVSINKDDNTPMPTVEVNNYKEIPNELVENTLKAIASEGYRVKNIRALDIKTYKLLEKASKDLNMGLKLDPNCHQLKILLEDMKEYDELEIEIADEERDNLHEANRIIEIINQHYMEKKPIPKKLIDGLTSLLVIHRIYSDNQSQKIIMALFKMVDELGYSG